MIIKLTNTKRVVPVKWGPHGQKAAISITFDNFGEAAELELNLWPADQPIGQHGTRTMLPIILRDLQQADLKGTFFIEGWNGDIYPESVDAIRAAGHEVACHGWRHEIWQTKTAHHPFQSRGPQQRNGYPRWFLPTRRQHLRHLCRAACQPSTDICVSGRGGCKMQSRFGAAAISLDRGGCTLL
ncbi:polysaccharide deacetylase family protein [Pseudomaricurvus hydrocarbonicus]